MSLRRACGSAKRILKVVAEFAPAQTYTVVWAFLGLVGHYRQFIKGLACVAQPLHEHLSREGAHKKTKSVMLMAEARDAFETLIKACLEAPVLAFADFDKPFLLETDTSKLGLGAVLSQKTGWQLISSDSICQLIPNYSWVQLPLNISGVFSTKVGDCWAVARGPPLETIPCQGWQQSAHIHHDYTQLRHYQTPMGGVTCMIHV